MMTNGTVAENAIDLLMPKFREYTMDITEVHFHRSPVLELLSLNMKCAPGYGSYEFSGTRGNRS